MPFTFKEASSELWPDLVELFGQKGACGGCWCQWFRIPHGGKMWRDFKGEKARRAMKKLFDSGQITGLLAYDGKQPVGWCSYGPRAVFPRVETMKAYRLDPAEDRNKIWSVNCFYIHKNYRQQGLAQKMLAAALKFLKKRKVKVVESYPVPLTKDGQKLPAAFVYTGPLTIFEQAGFEVIQRLSYTRPLMRKKL